MKTRNLLVGVGMMLVAGSNHASAASCIPPPPGLVASWTSDGHANDVLGANHAILLNGATFATGRVDQAFKFDGANDFVQATDSPLWFFGTNEFTIELWANFAVGSGTKALVASDTSGGSYNKWIFWLNGGTLQFHINGTNGSSSTIGTAALAPVPDQWYHLAVTRRGTNYTFYTNGVPSSTNSDTKAVPDATQPLTIGAAEGNFFFDGLLDEVAIYSRALSELEVQDICNAGSDGKCVPRSSGASVPYFTDFESGPGLEWSAAAAWETFSTNPFTRFGGRFGNESQVLTLTNLIVGESYTLGFDLYVIDSWEGNDGPDYFNVGVDGFQAFHETFANYNGEPPNSTQSFPGIPDEGRANFGFTASYVDAIYRNVEVAFVASNPTVQIAFSGQNLQPLYDESWGFDNVSVQLSAAAMQSFIRFTTLPTAGSTNAVALDHFSLTCNHDLLPASAVTTTNYTLREAGANGAFGDGDDVVYFLTPTHNGRKTVSLTFNNSPLQPGKYRVESKSSLVDTNGTAVAPFSREFAISHPIAGKIESVENDTLPGATSLLLTETPLDTGFFTALAVGTFASTGDVDYWRFDAEAGDRISVRLEADATEVYPTIQLRNAADEYLINQNGSTSATEFQNYVFLTPGNLYLRVLSNYKAAGYKMRVDLARGPQLEVEGNDSQGAANSLNFVTGPFQARVAGVLLLSDSAGDYFRVGVLSPGNAITASLVPTTGSLLNRNETICRSRRAETMSS